MCLWGELSLMAIILVNHSIRYKTPINYSTRFVFNLGRKCKPKCLRVWWSEIKKVS